MDLAVVWENLPKLIHGALTTLELTTVSVAIGLCMAVPLALMRVSSNPLLRLPVHGFIFYFRGTPLLVQIYFLFYGLPEFGILFPPFSWPCWH